MLAQDLTLRSKGHQPHLEIQISPSFWPFVTTEPLFTPRFLGSNWYPVITLSVPWILGQHVRFPDQGPTP